jgi:multiple sugar transport system ATP-binding protein
MGAIALSTRFNMAKVRLQNVTRKFGNSTAIEEIAFEVPDGEFWVLVGPSGCGKSTILRAIAGLETITEGEIYIGETLVNQIRARQRDVAMVFQNYALYPHMKVFDNLAFGLRMRNCDRATITQKVTAIARSLDLESLLDRKPAQLSGGQQQRVALGRAIIREPKVFLLDEPLSNLDARLRDETRTQLKQLHARLGITTIYVTHDQLEAMTLADRIVILNRGRIQQIGSPEEIYTQPANRMVATFLGSPSMNIVPAIYENGTLKIGDRTFLVTDKQKEALKASKSQNIELGIRPEDLSIASPLNEKTNEIQLPVKVDLIEPLGRETLIRGILSHSEIALNFYTSAWRGQRGDLLTLQCDREGMFIFDVETGKTLSGGMMREIRDRDESIHPT